MSKVIDFKTEFMTVPEFMRWARIGRTKTYEELAAGRLRAVKVGRKTLIRMPDAHDWARSNPDYPIYVDIRKVLGAVLPDGP
jgi:excisionase family DNA binding protein